MDNKKFNESIENLKEMSFLELGVINYIVCSDEFELNFNKKQLLKYKKVLRDEIMKRIDKHKKIMSEENIDLFGPNRIIKI